MKMPELEQPESYTGLYVFDFDGQVAVGYTADEITVLLESEKYREGKVYRIHRALPDGTLELAGVPRERFELEDGLFFHRAEESAAQRDYADLLALAQGSPPPCRMKVQRAVLSGPVSTHLVALIFPAEHTHDVSAWLTTGGYMGGDTVEGGPSQVTGYYESAVQAVERQQLWPTERAGRSVDEVLASTHLPIQRRPWKASA